VSQVYKVSRSLKHKHRDGEIPCILIILALPLSPSFLEVLKIWKYYSQQLKQQLMRDIRHDPRANTEACENAPLRTYPGDPLNLNWSDVLN